MIVEIKGKYLPMVTPGPDQYSDALTQASQCNMNIVAHKSGLNSENLTSIIGELGRPVTPDNVNHFQKLLEKLNSEKDLDPQR